MFLTFSLAVILTFIVTVVLSKKFIPVLISKKLNQPIYEIGPRWHKSKSGTPTMGGLFFIGAILLAAAIFSTFAVEKEELLPLWLTLAMAVLFGLVGFIDDRAKLLKKQNEGLRAHQKFLLQLVVSGLYLFGMTLFCDLSTTVTIPFTAVQWDLGIAYYPLALLLITGIDNSVNLTDGIDGLCATTSAVVSVFFIAVGVSIAGFAGGISALVLLGGLMFGGCLGFLVYNWNPARIFMGDTGSLFLGGLAAGLAFLAESPLIILVVGIVYVIETASVILQVAYFKLTHGKRLFKMAPIHHHFEKCGWKETSIVFLAAAVTLIVSVVSYIFAMR